MCDLTFFFYIFCFWLQAITRHPICFGWNAWHVFECLGLFSILPLYFNQYCICICNIFFEFLGVTSILLALILKLWDNKFPFLFYFFLIYCLRVHAAWIFPLICLPESLPSTAGSRAFVSSIFQLVSLCHIWRHSAG